MLVSTFSENKIYNVTAQNVISYFKYFISTTNKKSITEAKKNCLQMFISSTTPPNYKWIKYLPLSSVIKKNTTRQDTATCQIDWEIPVFGREKNRSFPNEDSTWSAALSNR